MKITPENLHAHLERQALKPVYWISGDEHLIRDECGDQIRHATRQHGYIERDVFTVDANGSWDSILNTLRTPSLFAEKKRLEINLTRTSLSKNVLTGINTLFSEIELCSKEPYDIITLIISAKLENRQTQSAWYRQLMALGAHIPVWPIARQALPNWIQRRAKNENLSLAPEVPDLLANLVEGNLLAAKQEIEKLALLFPNDVITAEHLEQTCSDLAQYSTFDAIDTILSGDIGATLRRLKRLQDSGAEPVLILWGLAREVRCLQNGLESLARGISLSTWISQQRLLPQRQKLVQQALRRLEGFPTNTALEMCFLIDRGIKGQSKLDPWFGLSVLSTAIASGKGEALEDLLHTEMA